MKDLDEHKKIAVLIDADNAQYAKVKAILDEISAHGHIVIKRAYGDWSSDYLKNWKKSLNELAIQPVQQFAYTTGKNSTDASMIIDAMDLLYSKRFDAFALVSSDSDFTKLASRLREDEMFVFGVGERKTPISFRNSCDDFIFTENLGSDEVITAAKATDKPKEQEAKASLNDPSELIPLLTKAWEQYQDDNGWANVSVAGSFLKRSMPDFDPRSYGASKFSQLLESLKGKLEITKKKGNGNQIAYKVKPKKNKSKSRPQVKGQKMSAEEYA
ncbi:NYN domain-containing protein [Microbulbifer agarilyticus]|uniref:NYN domain-containing protein n=1 Tax=Microbulbifer agarilyticus TaxID=260552 RepID=UPI001CD22329|nr:NYN domain-containing protein [Microbulbifer agarilyticus]MCA0899132.1 NYN domain-containing protein [Microbulbifer agarilyticus]